MSNSVRWFTRKYICRNGIEERTKFCVRSSQKGTRLDRAVRKASRASDNAERQLARLSNNNFDTEDKHLVLEYTDVMLRILYERALRSGIEPFEDAMYFKAKKEFDNWIRRVQRKLKGVVEFKYIGITSDLDGEKKTPVRLHHHVVINKEALETCKEKWKGFVLDADLYTVHNDFSALAAYLINQVRYIPNAKRYTPSRNLEPPKTTKPVEITRYGDSEMRIPKGCIKLYRSEYAKGANQYIRYYRPPKDERFNNKNGRRQI